jgi:hypothetical protein
MSFIKAIFSDDKGENVIFNGMSFTKYLQENNEINKYVYHSDDVNITAIGDGIFQGSDTLVSINVPNSVETIGESAFKDCANLTNVSLSFNKNFTVLKRELFKGCSNLRKFKTPIYVQTIEDECFADCVKLDTIIMSQNVTSISANAFNGCAVLKNNIAPYIGRICSDSQGGGYVNSYFLPMGNANGFYLNGLITTTNYQEWYEIYGYL